MFQNLALGTILLCQLPFYSCFCNLEITLYKTYIAPHWQQVLILLLMCYRWQGMPSVIEVSGGRQWIIWKKVGMESQKRQFLQATATVANLKLSFLGQVKPSSKPFRGFSLSRHWFYYCLKSPVRELWGFRCIGRRGKDMKCVGENAWFLATISFCIQEFLEEF